MAKAQAAAKQTTQEETADSPLLDTLGASVKKMVTKGKERSYVTYDELNAALPPDEASSEQIEDTMAMLSEMGINVVENEEQEETASNDDEEEEKKESSAAGNVDENDLGRTDDPVRMYLREMGSVELLSREGEIAIAKRIEAGREAMIAGLCESPLTFQAIIIWRDELNEGRILLRDIIDLEATYAGPDVDDPEAEVQDDNGIFYAMESLVNELFDLYQQKIDSVNTQATFSGSQKLREGWLKLKPVAVAAEAEA